MRNATGRVSDRALRGARQHSGECRAIDSQIPAPYFHLHCVAAIIAHQEALGLELCDRTLGATRPASPHRPVKVAHVGPIVVT